MDGLIRIQKSIFEIRQLILNNLNIRKLLVHDGKDALIEETPTIAEASEHVFLSPVFNVNIEPYNKNTFITINLESDDIYDEDEYHDIEINISCLSRTELWVLNNEKIRTLELCSNIINSLNNKKTASSHKLSYQSMRKIVFNENIQGYFMVFGLIDGGGLENDF